jgi:hypothetical protein
MPSVAVSDTSSTTPGGTRGRRDQRLAPRDLDLELALADRRPQQPQVEGAVEQARDLGGRQQLAAEVEHHAEQRLAQRAGQRGQRGVGRRAREADRRPPVLAVRRAPGVLRGAVDRRQDVARPREEHRSARRELDPPGGAAQQRRADLALEPVDVLRERRLRE